MAPALPARAPPVRISNNQQRSYDQVQYQSYPDSTTYHGAEGHGAYRDVTHHYEDGQGEAVGGFEGELDQGEGEDEEAQEQDLDPEVEQEEDYPGGEPVYDEEEQGYNTHDYESYGAGQAIEEGEDEYDGGYGHQASRRW